MEPAAGGEVSGAAPSHDTTPDVEAGSCADDAARAFVFEAPPAAGASS
jgi:hypothetical protein